MRPSRTNPLSPPRQKVVREFQGALTRPQRQSVFERYEAHVAATPMTRAEREVLLRYYRDTERLAEIAAGLHPSRSRISQLKARAVR